AARVRNGTRGRRRRPAARPARPRPGNRLRYPAHGRPLPRLGAGRRSADFPRRIADRVYATLGQQDRRQMGVGALDHERRRVAPPVPGEGIRRAVVAGRHAHPVLRGRRAQGHPDIRALDGCAGRVVPGDAPDRDADGRTIVFDGLRDSTWDRQYQVSRVYALDVASGAIRPLVSRPGFWASPAVSPDGRTVALTGSDSSDHTHRTSDLWTVGLDGSGLRDLSRTLDRDPDNLRWAPDGKGVYFT